MNLVQGTCMDTLSCRNLFECDYLSRTGLTIPVEIRTRYTPSLYHKMYQYAEVISSSGLQTRNLQYDIPHCRLQTTCNEFLTVLFRNVFLIEMKFCEQKGILRTKLCSIHFISFLAYFILFYFLYSSRFSSWRSFCLSVWCSTTSIVTMHTKTPKQNPMEFWASCITLRIETCILAIVPYLK